MSRILRGSGPALEIPYSVGDTESPPWECKGSEFRRAPSGGSCTLRGKIPPKATNSSLRGGRSNLPRAMAPQHSDAFSGRRWPGRAFCLFEGTDLTTGSSRMSAETTQYVAHYSKMSYYILFFPLTCPRPKEYNAGHTTNARHHRVELVGTGTRHQKNCSNIDGCNNGNRSFKESLAGGATHTIEAREISARRQGNTFGQSHSERREAKRTCTEKGGDG